MSSKFNNIKNTDLQRTQNIRSRFNVIAPNNEIEPLVIQLESLVSNLEITNTLNDHLEIKLLVQEIEKMLDEAEDGNPGPGPEPKPEEPKIDSVKLYLTGSNILKAQPQGVTDKDSVISNYKYTLKCDGNVVETKELSTDFEVTFTSNTPGLYTASLEYFYDLGEGVVSKKLFSDPVLVEDEVEDGDFPSELPYSNSWAYAIQQGNSIEVTLNNTWGTISPKLAVYVNGKLKGTHTVNYTALNKGSAKNIVDIASVSSSATRSTDDVKVVYKVSFKREDKEDTVVYYKSTTGEIAIANPSGGQMCKHVKWSESLAGDANSMPIVWHNGAHWKASYWISAGDVPGQGENGWKQYDYPECPDVTSADVHTEFAPSGSHLTPMNPAEVESIGTPMEKKHITYMPEWAKWLARKYTPKVAPWDKLSHVQYSFIDVRPDYTNGFDLDKDVNVIPMLHQSVKECPTYNGQIPISPNVFEPGAAFSNWGGTNAFHTEFVEYSKKFPYVEPVMSLGGWSRSGYFRDAASDSNRAFFVERCIDLMKVLNIRGIDIDWEFPGDRRDGDTPDNANDMGTPRGSSTDEAQLYTLLMRDLRAALDAQGEADGKYYTLSVAIPAGKKHMDNSGAADWHQYCDFISYMTYDTHGAFDGYTNHQSYTHQNPNEDQSVTNPTGLCQSIETVIEYANTQFGIPKYKLIVGTPFYSRGWSGVTKPANGWAIPSLPGLYAPANYNGTELQGNAAPGVMDGGRGAGVMPVRHLNVLKAGGRISVNTLDIEKEPNPFHGTKLNGANFKHYYDEAAQVPYLFSETDGIFYTYEDERSVDYKSKFTIDQGIGGLISWDITLDDYGSFANGIDGETYNYGSLRLEDHKLTDVIFENFKTK